MFITIYLGEAIYDLKYSTGTQVENAGDSYTTSFGLVVPTVKGLEATDKLKHMTIIFDTFVFL